MEDFICRECGSPMGWEELERQLEETGEVICPECESTDIDVWGE